MSNIEGDENFFVGSEQKEISTKNGMLKIVTVCLPEYVNMF